MSKASDIISQATTTIVLDHPFFATLLLQMPRIEDPSVPTACTDGVVIRYNPKFVESLTANEVAGLLAHEVLHPALGHLWRLPCDRDGNIAGDYAINNFLDTYNQSAGHRKLSLPKGGLIDHKFDGMSAEQILAIVRKRPKDEDEGDGNGNPQPGNGGNGGKQRTAKDGAWGEFDKPGATPEASPDSMRHEWDRRLVQAATVCKMQGKYPGCIEALVKDLVDPKVPWPQLLHRFFDQTSCNDYSWAKPDRRFLPDDIVLPDLHDETLGEIVVAVDTSGSIFCDKTALSAFQTEINSIISRTRPSKTHVVYCDAAVAHVDEYHDGAEITITPRGGGGTDFRPVGTWIENNNVNPRVCIYLTDLYGTFPDQEWPFPTIWCVYGNDTDVAPFGDTIRIKD